MPLTMPAEGLIQKLPELLEKDKLITPVVTQEILEVIAGLAALEARGQGSNISSDAVKANQGAMVAIFTYKGKQHYQIYPALSIAGLHIAKGL